MSIEMTYNDNCYVVLIEFTLFMYSWQWKYEGNERIRRYVGLFFLNSVTKDELLR